MSRHQLLTEQVSCVDNHLYRKHRMTEVGVAVSPAQIADTSEDESPNRKCVENEEEYIYIYVYIYMGWTVGPKQKQCDLKIAAPAMASRIAAQWSSLSHVHFRWTAEGWKVAKNIKALLGVTFRKITCLHTLTTNQIGKSSSTNHNSLATLFTFTYLYYPLLVGCVGPTSSAKAPARQALSLRSPSAGESLQMPREAKGNLVLNMKFQCGRG